MAVLDTMVPVAREKACKIVLPEGQDPRVIGGAVKAAREGVAKPVVLGTPDEISAAEEKAGVSLSSAGVEVIDYTGSDLLPQLAEALYERRKAKGMSHDDALSVLKTRRIYFGGMMVSCDLVDGMVAGSIASTGDMLRSAFHCIGTATGIKLASSCFVMDLPQPTISGDSTLIFSDCGVNPDPSSEQLVDIALAAAGSYKTLIGGTPRVAFLSYSTKGSAEHEFVTKVSSAAAMAKTAFKEAGIDAVVDGEMQGDAALVPSVAASKNKNGAIKGDANVLIFPDIQSGNIAYKLVERLAGAVALGPILQGLAKPVNDLSRGCSAEDIFGTIIITSLQS
ncbi:MAG: phosphate acetyltransferase [Kiritimatiellia bacterium]